MATRTQRGRGRGRGRQRFGHSQLRLLPRPRRTSASDVAICGTSSSLQAHSHSPLSPHSLLPFPLSATVQIHGLNYHDWSVTRSAPGVRVEGWKGSRTQRESGISELCHARVQLSTTICWYVCACRVRMRCDVTLVATGCRFGDRWRWPCTTRSAL